MLQLQSLTWNGVIQIVWVFLQGLADSIRGGVDMFLLDRHGHRESEDRRIARESRQESLLNRESPARDMETFAKKRAIERREKERHNKLSGGRAARKEEPRILERTLKCGLLNGFVFGLSIFIFDNVILPLIQWLFLIFGGAETSERLWQWTQPALSLTFSALWVIPFYLLSKLVNAIWFQDIADSAFRSSKGRHRQMSSFSVMIADTIFSLFVEIVFLLQGKLCSYLPIPSLGYCLHILHLSLLNSLYCFEYKWFNQGLELHKRLMFIERHWPYFLGFGLPLSVLANVPESFFISGCFYSVMFPVFIVSANQAHVVTMTDNCGKDLSLHIFHPTILISNKIFSRTFTSNSSVSSASSSASVSYASVGRHS